MLLKVNREIDRCKRVMRERVWPHIHQTLGTCAVGAVKNPGEPWGTSWGTTWMRVEGQLPADLPEGRAIELVFNLGWLEWPIGGHIEALAYRADGTVDRMTDR